MAFVVEGLKHLIARGVGGEQDQSLKLTLRIFFSEHQNIAQRSLLVELDKVYAADGAILCRVGNGLEQAEIFARQVALHFRRVAQRSDLVAEGLCHQRLVGCLAVKGALVFAET